MGGMLSQPVTEKQCNQGDGLGLRYGICSMQGWRSEMEDAHDVQIGLKYGLDDWSFFAVFDGHAGKRAAAFAAWNLLEFILRDEQFKLDTDKLTDNVHIEPNVQHESIKVNYSSFSKQDGVEKQPKGEEMGKIDREPDKSEAKKDDVFAIGDGSNSEATTQQNPSSPSSTLPIEPEESPEGKQPTTTDIDSDRKMPRFVTLSSREQLLTVKEAIRSGFLRIDQKLRDLAKDTSGSTAICSLISPTHLFIANCGDSRAVLSNGKECMFATEDHKPVNPKERARIIAAGGDASQRINGTLAVSRALGDFEFKKDPHIGPCEQLVSPEPEVTVIERSSQHAFLVLACDGIWDVMSNDQLCEFIEYKLKIEPELEDVCSAVLDVCLHKGSRDNMSIIIVVFENGPEFSEEELARDLENDELLKALIRELIVPDKFYTFDEFMFYLQERIGNTETQKPWNSNTYLPPGAGLTAKHEMIHEMFEKEFDLKLDANNEDK